MKRIMNIFHGFWTKTSATIEISIFSLVIVELLNENCAEVAKTVSADSILDMLVNISLVINVGGHANHVLAVGFKPCA